MTNLPHAYAVANAGDFNRWVATYTDGVHYSPDFGDTWIDKTGDLLDYISGSGANIFQIEVLQ